MSAGLTAREVERFESDGVVFPVAAFGGGEIAERYDALKAIEQVRAGRLPPLLNFKPYLLIPWLWDMVHEARILNAVEPLVGPDILCWEASFFSKEPNDRAFVSWHQDATYWGLSENIGVTAWIAFTPSTRENGCMRVIKGSHTQVLAHSTGADPSNMLPFREQVRPMVDESQAIDVILEPGEMSLHHPMIVHGSEPNTSQTRRVGLAIRYINARVQQQGEHRGTAILVRGRDHGHFDLEQCPSGEPSEDRARHAESFRRWMKIVKP